MLIAAWSGPRNLSTAMMYAFAQRGDCAVRDEPFYAPWLAAEGVDHPMRNRILSVHGTDAGRVIEDLRSEGTPLTYLKLMAHHMTPDMPLDWADTARHLHLIRHPARVVASYAAKRDRPSLDDIGVPDQRRLYERFGGTVIDSETIRADPARALRALCAALGIDYDPAMLTWPAGGHPSDGVWAEHWYGAVHCSTGFAAPEPPLPRLTGAASDLVAAALPDYDALWRHRLTPE